MLRGFEAESPGNPGNDPGFESSVDRATGAHLKR
jgi:hypothetical protein